jgi:hypothetical protein
LSGKNALQEILDTNCLQQCISRWLKGGEGQGKTTV